MVKFTFTVRDEDGLQPARAGELVKEAAKCTSKVAIRRGEKTGDAKLIFNVIALSARHNDELEITVKGEREEEEAAALEAYVKSYI